MNEYIIAKYIRLSIEDEKTESMSVPHQRLILDRYIDELDVPNIKVMEFVDNGHSGTDMERPAVQEMLELVRSGRINCIAVKDFSRFSRNSMDSGYFIEQVFPLYQVRFISVSDSFDSNDYKNDTGGIDIAFKFLMHEYYSRDLSKKVRSARRIQMARGENIVANAIYGYRKNELGKWEPDPGSAEVVQLIFQMVLNGNATSQIRDSLCASRLPTPKEYIELKRGKDVDPKSVWTARMIRHILENEQYIGTYISGKQESKAVGSSSKDWVDKSEWIIIPDSHPPIVSKEDFAAAQEILSRYKNFSTAKPVNNVLQDDVDRPKRSKMINGERLANNVIYGYAKGENGTLKIDQDAASVILEMYQLAAQGLSVREIRDRLTEAGYPVPYEHIKISKGFDTAPTCLWTDKSVRSILKNVQYTGAYVSGKILKNYNTGKKYHTAQSDWIIIPDMNPVIVCKELFDEVQTNLANGKRNNPPRDNLLRGSIVKCGCCGYALAYDGSTRTAVYRCHHTLADLSAECRKLKVVAAELDEIVLAIIRKQAEVVLNTADLSELRKMGADGKHIADYEKEIKTCIEQRQQVYERFVLREIDSDAYQSLRSGYTERFEMLNNQVAVLKQAERDAQTGQKTAAIAKHALNESATPREIVETLIDKVLVFPGRRIEIRWKIAGFMQSYKT
jgi:DNA invertase Pin-like site-specific DNA recombinase